MVHIPALYIVPSSDILWTWKELKNQNDTYRRVVGDKVGTDKVAPDPTEHVYEGSVEPA